MKTWILAVAMMAAVTVSAQESKMMHEPLKPEQRAELRAKEMTLELSLTEKQQKEVKSLFLEQSKKAEQFKVQRKANTEKRKAITADERFTMRSKMLDEKIAMQKEMKKILNAEQFSKWEKMKDKRHAGMKKHNRKFKKHNTK